MLDSKMRLGFRVAAAYNIVGILVFTRLFTNRVMFDTDPSLFSAAGCALIMIWGLAYFAQSVHWRVAPWVTAVFAVEKSFFAVWWLAWLAREGHRLAEIRAADLFAGGFYSIYGAGDGLFAGFFVWAFIQARRAR